MSTSPSRSPAEEPRPKLILIVDDSATVLLMERLLFRGTPWELLTATDGEQAVSLARERKPDLVLMDVVMPRMDGLAACRALRSHEATREIPVLLLTTRGEAENIEKGWDAGCADYLTKPVDRAALLSKIRDLIGE